MRSKSLARIPRRSANPGMLCLRPRVFGDLGAGQLFQTGTESISRHALVWAEGGTTRRVAELVVRGALPKE
eukprot:7058145-Pyramimonas_sp.AAC.1